MFKNIFLHNFSFNLNKNMFNHYYSAYKTKKEIFLFEETHEIILLNNIL
jgi:hypothetical protein